MYLRTRLRDRAMLTALYSCGLRRSEVVNLDVNDVLFDRALLFVKKAKNFKQRYVPVNSYNLRILEDYRYEARPLYPNKGSEAFFINRYGNRLHGQDMAKRLQHLIELTDGQRTETKTDNAPLPTALHRDTPFTAGGETGRYTTVLGARLPKGNTDIYPLDKRPYERVP